jgi:AcrR family transcriptional regulator
MLTNHSISEPPVRSRRQQAAWRREQILDAALTVFAHQGIEGASMKDVAAAAGVAPGLLYHYFAGKEELVVAVLDRHDFLPELRRLLESATDTPVAAVLEALLTHFAQYLAGQPERVALYFAGYANPRVRAALHAAIAEGKRLLSDFLAARVATGELRPHDRETAVQLLLSPVVFGQVAGLALSPPALVDLFLRGVEAPGSPPPREPRSMTREGS